MRSNQRQRTAKPLGFESEVEIFSLSPGLAYLPAFFSNPAQNGFEKNSAPLRYGNLRTKCVKAISLFVVPTDIFDDADLPFSIKDASEVANLKFREHDFHPMVSVHDNTPLRRVCHA